MCALPNKDLEKGLGQSGQWARLYTSVPFSQRIYLDHEAITSEKQVAKISLF